MFNLNLGAGSNRRQDYISVDFFTDADIVHDLREPLPFDDESVDNIYTCHFIEHLSRAEWINVYPSWVRVLKPGGTIEIRCPDIVKSCQKLVDDPDNEWPLRILYGNQDTPGEYHKNGFTERYLRNCFITLEGAVLPPSTDYELHMIFTKEEK